MLDQLPNKPFEPKRKAYLKFITFKTVFLLALASGKRRSEIHAWLHEYVRSLDKWTSVSLQLSAEFIAKNQLAKEGAQ